MEDIKGNKFEIDEDTKAVFNAEKDFRVLGIKSPQNEDVIMRISGYGLDISFNYDYIKSVEDIENLLDGVKDVFRKMILENMIDKK